LNDIIPALARTEYKRGIENLPVRDNFIQKKWVLLLNSTI